MLKSFAVLCALLFVVAGCQPREITGPEPCVDPEQCPDREEPTATPPSATFLVEYVVEGTYYDCQITFVDHKRRETTLDQPQRLPWSTSFRVEIHEATGAFDAVVSATCADPTKAGKSTAMVRVDSELKATDSAVGYGATARAEHSVWFR